VLAELKTYHGEGLENDRGYVPGVPEIGVILDFCSLWQRGQGDEDKRTASQLRDFKNGLAEINTPYAHKEITAVKLIDVPEEVVRKYDDRGWTLFESVVIDGKAGSEMIYCGCEPQYNVLTVTNLDLDNELASGFHFVKKFAMGERRPPCTPDRFAWEMEKRKTRAEHKGVQLFTNGKDQSFIVDKYSDAFLEQTRLRRYTCANMGWGPSEMESVVEVLVYCENLEVLHLATNQFGDEGVELLAPVLPELKQLKELNLFSNNIGPTGAAKLARVLPKLKGLQKLWLGQNNITPAGAKKLAAVLPKLTRLQVLDLRESIESSRDRRRIRKAAPKGCEVYFLETDLKWI
jgi:hypothetical protein